MTQVPCKKYAPWKSMLIVSGVFVQDECVCFFNCKHCFVESVKNYVSYIRKRTNMDLISNRYDE